jgi:hypothetical protein
MWQKVIVGLLAAMVLTACQPDDPNNGNAACPCSPGRTDGVSAAQVTYADLSTVFPDGSYFDIEYCWTSGQKFTQLIDSQAQWESAVGNCVEYSLPVLDWTRTQVVLSSSGDHLGVDIEMVGVSYDFKQKSDGTLHLDIFECIPYDDDCDCAYISLHGLIVLVDQTDPARVTSVDIHAATYCEDLDDPVLGEYPYADAGPDAS